MKTLTAVLCSMLLVASPLAYSQEKKDSPKKEPTAAQQKQQQRMKDCNEKAGAKKMEGDARKKFMSACLKGQAEVAEKGEKRTAQQNKMTACNKQAGDKKLKGEERKQFMSGCLKG